MKAAHSFVCATIEGRQYVPVKAAAPYLGLHWRTVYNLVNDKRSPLQSRDWYGQILIEIGSLEAEKKRRDGKPTNNCKEVAS